VFWNEHAQCGFRSQTLDRRGNMALNDTTRTRDDRSGIRYLLYVLAAIVVAAVLYSMLGNSFDDRSAAPTTAPQTTTTPGPATK
jgi:hypothetical protein